MTEKSPKSPTPENAKNSKKAAETEVAWDASPAPGTRKSFIFNGVEFAFRYCPPGTFTMGSPFEETGSAFFDDETLHEVTLTRGFWLAETPTTQAQFQAVCVDNPSWFSASGIGASEVRGLETSDFPVESVSWNGCQDFLKLLNAFDLLPPGWTFRLPTEAEWERACRAGTQTAFSFGTTIDLGKANFNGVAVRNPTFDDPNLEGTEVCVKWEAEWRRAEALRLERTSAVRSYPPNALGLYDMHGNVAEWVQDWYGPYPEGPQVDPTGPAKGRRRVLRGGSFMAGGDWARSAYRGSAQAKGDYIDRGFRLAVGPTVDSKRGATKKKSDAPPKKRRSGPVPTPGSFLQSGETGGFRRWEERAKDNFDGAWDDSPTPGARKSFVFNGVEFAFRYCPPGTFGMGSLRQEIEFLDLLSRPPFNLDYERRFVATLTNGFWLAETPTTRAQYAALTSKRTGKRAADALPVEAVAWDDAQAFCAKLNDFNLLTPGWTFRLPTEAEWERACRAGSTGRRYVDFPLDELAWTAANSGGRARPVGGKLGNAWGLFDMLGNVAEWTADVLAPYPRGAATDPFCSTEPQDKSRERLAKVFGRITKRVLRGGSYLSSPGQTRCAARKSKEQHSGRGGFRLVVGRPLTQPPQTPTE